MFGLRKFCFIKDLTANYSLSYSLIRSEKTVHYSKVIAQNNETADKSFATDVKLNTVGVCIELFKLF